MAPTLSFSTLILVFLAFSITQAQTFVPPPEAPTPSLVGSPATATLFGCPAIGLLQLASACPTTSFPSCATAPPADGLDDICCGSYSSWGSSVVSCVTAKAPSCLDIPALESYYNYEPSMWGTANPCAKFAAATPTGESTRTGSSKSTTSSLTTVNIYPTPKNAGNGMGVAGWRVSLGIAVALVAGMLHL